jgi:hypothetical protein
MSSTTTVLPGAWDIVAKFIPGILRLVSGEEHDVRPNPQNASFIYHAHPAMGMRGGRGQNHGQEPRGDSSDHFASEASMTAKRKVAETTFLQSFNTVSHPTFCDDIQKVRDLFNTIPTRRWLPLRRQNVWL